MDLTELQKGFGDIITEARRADLSSEERRRLVDVVEREVRMILQPLDDGDAWGEIGFRRTSR